MQKRLWDLCGKHLAWWRHRMETFSALLNLCAGNSPFTAEVPSQRPMTQSFDVFFYLRLKKQLSKQSWGWWFKKPSRPLWCHCNGQWKSDPICVIVIFNIDSLVTKMLHAYFTINVSHNIYGMTIGRTELFNDIHKLDNAWRKMHELDGVFFGFILLKQFRKYLIYFQLAYGTRWYSIKYIDATPLLPTLDRNLTFCVTWKFRKLSLAILNKAIWSTELCAMITLSNWNIFRVTGPLWGESACRWRIPLTKASDAELWWFLWTASEQTVE